MARVWGDTSAIFWDLDQIPSGAPVTAPYAEDIVIVEDSVEWVRMLSQVGSGRASFYATINWGDYIQPGRIVAITQAVTGYSFFQRLLAAFIIEEIEPNTRDGISVIDVRGPGVESLLTKFPVWSPIGEEVILETTLSAGASLVSTTLAEGAPAGNDAAELATVSGVSVGDELRIRMGVSDDGAWHVARITSVNPPGAPANVVQFAPDIPANATSGNSVVVRPAALELSSVAEMKEGQRIDITLNSAAIFTSIIMAVDSGASTVTIRDGLTSAANSGNDVAVYDYSARTSSDVTQILQHAGDWGAYFETGNGTAEGTAYVPEGESVFDLLLSTAERTGEFFRYWVSASNIPSHAIQWRRTPDSSGMTVILYDTDEYARQVTDELSETKGTAFDLRRKVSVPLLTRIYPSAGDQVITLSQCTNDALSYALTAGCYVDLSDDLYEPDSVAFGIGRSMYGELAIRETYGDISINDAGNLAEVQAASDALLLSAVNSLVQAHLREQFTVEAYLPKPVLPGQTIKLENFTRVEPPVFPSTEYVVLEVIEKQTNGRPRTRLTVSNQLGLRRTSANVLGKTIQSTVQSLRRVGKAAAGGNTRGLTIVGAGAGGGGDHGGLTGLFDDDHLQYLLTTGGRPLTGNLTVSPGATIDGVDISGHAADPAAHHAPVTAANYGIQLTGQAVGARLSSYNPGLTITTGLTVLLPPSSGLELGATGLALSDAIAGQGLKIAAKVLHVDLMTNSGLKIDTDQLRLGTPGTLSAITANTLTGESHAHAVTATANGQYAVNTLLKSGTAGELQLERLGLGASNSGTETLFIQPVTPLRGGQRIRAAASQYAPLWRVENSTGQALLLLTNDGSLESGQPGFVSGLTGWQITATGDAEFNNAFIRGELHASVFVADEMHATGGTLAVMTASKVANPVGANDNKLPAATGQTFILNSQASWETAMPYFATGDVLRIKTMTRYASGLHVYDIYLTVNTIGALTGRDTPNGEAGYYSMIVTWWHGGAAGIELPAGSALVRWGKTNQAAGKFTGALLLTADMNQSPYMDVFTVPADQPELAWANPAAASVLPKPRVRVGNLDGVLGLTEQWGIAAGTDLSDTTATARYFVASDKQLRLNNVSLYLYNGLSPTVEWLSTGDLRVGTNVGSEVTTTLKFETASGALRVGPFETGKPNLFWDGYSLSLRQYNQAVIKLSGNGSSYFEGPMQIGTAGGIWQGTGTFAAPTTGLKLYNTGGIGRLSTFNSGLEQLTINSSGQLTAGNGAVILDRGGLSFVASTALDWPGSLSIKNSNGALVGRLVGTTDTGSGYNVVQLNAFTVSPGNSNYGTSIRMDSSGAILMTAGGADGEGIFTFEDDRLVSTVPIYAMHNVLVGGGLTVGNFDTAAPSRIIRLAERTDGAGAPPTGFGDLFLINNGAKQILYFRFANGVLKELGSSI